MHKFVNQNSITSNQWTNLNKSTSKNNLSVKPVTSGAYYRFDKSNQLTRSIKSSASKS